MCACACVHACVCVCVHVCLCVCVCVMRACVHTCVRMGEIVSLDLQNPLVQWSDGSCVEGGGSWCGRSDNSSVLL